MSSDDNYQEKKYYEGWIYHKPGSGKNKEWTKYWMVLRGDKLFLFVSNRTIRENMIGMLRLSHKTKLSTKNSKKAYTFDLVTVSAEGKKQDNSFKFENQNDRDLWKAFIIGLTTGMIPTDVKLLPGQLNIVTDALSSYQSSPAPAARSPSKSPGSVSQLDSSMMASMESGREEDGWAADDAPEAVLTLRQRQTELMARQLEEANSQSVTRSDEGPNISLHPTLHRNNRLRSLAEDNPHTFDQDNHLFYLDYERNKLIPPWYFENCSREESEEILTVGRRYGNILVRPSARFINTGRYVLSFRQEDSGVTKLHHYSVIRNGSQFKLDVKNDHKPMSCLSEVLEFFSTVAGSAARPLSTNDRSKLFRQSQGSSSDSGSQISHHSSNSSQQAWNTSQQRTSFSKPLPQAPNSYKRSESFESSISSVEHSSSSPQSSLSYGVNNSSGPDEYDRNSSRYGENRRDSAAASEFSVSVSTLKERLSRQFTSENSSVPERHSVISSAVNQSRGSSVSQTWNDGTLDGSTLKRPESVVSSTVGSTLKRTPIQAPVAQSYQREGSVYSERSMGAPSEVIDEGEDQEIYSNASEVNYPATINEEEDTFSASDDRPMSSVAELKARMFQDFGTSSRRTSTASSQFGAAAHTKTTNRPRVDSRSMEDELREKLNRQRETIYSHT